MRQVGNKFIHRRTMYSKVYFSSKIAVWLTIVQYIYLPTPTARDGCHHAAFDGLGEAVDAVKIHVKKVGHGFLLSYSSKGPNATVQ